MKTLKNLRRSKDAGFTLIEILVVIGIIAVLAAVVLVAINPARQFAQARDSQRDSNVNAILNGIGQYIADNKGDEPGGLPTGDSTDDSDYEDAAILCDDLMPTYVPAFPTDPNSSYDGEGIDDCDDLGDDSEYLVIKDSTTGRITVKAPNTEERDEDIAVTR